MTIFFKETQKMQKVHRPLTQKNHSQNSTIVSYQCFSFYSYTKHLTKNTRGFALFFRVSVKMEHVEWTLKCGSIFLIAFKDIFSVLKFYSPFISSSDGADIPSLKPLISMMYSMLNLCVDGILILQKLFILINSYYFFVL